MSANRYSRAGRKLLKQDLRREIDPALQEIETHYGQPESLTVTSWTIDAVNGSDSAPNANGAVLKTARELLRRWGSGPLMPALVSITQVGDLEANDQWNIEGLQSGGQFPVPQVVVTVLPSATRDLPALTGVTPIDHTQPHDCAQYVTITGHSWTAEIDQLAVIQSGPRAGLVMFPDTDVGSGKCRLSPPLVPTGSLLDAPTSPQPGDVLTIFTPGKCHNLNISGTDVSFRFINAWFDDENGFGHNVEHTGNSNLFSGCMFDGFTYYAFGVGGFFQACHFKDNLYTSMSQVFSHGCHYIGGAYAFEGTGDIGADTLFRNSRAFLIGPAGGANHMDALGAVAAYGTGFGAVIGVGQGGQVYAGNYGSGEACILYGSADYNIDVHTNSQVIYDAGAQFKTATAIAPFVQGGVLRSSLPCLPDESGNAIVAANGGPVGKPVITYTAGATTIDITAANGRDCYVVVANSTPTTISNITGAVTGQSVTIVFRDANTTIDRTNAVLPGGANIVSAAYKVAVLVKTSDAGGYWHAVSVSTNS